jgi:acetyl esterase/lipase
MAVSDTIVYLYGGAGLFGSPADLDPRHRVLLEEAGFTVIVPDYPKAIATPLRHTVSTVAETVADIAASARGGRVIVMGHSFGGYLALWIAATQSTVIRAVAFAGYGDLLASWYTEPSAHYLGVKDLGDFDPASVTPAASSGERFDLYLSLRQTGTWSDYVSKGDLASLESLSPLRLPPSDVPVFLVHGTGDTDVPYTASVAYYERIVSDSPGSRLHLHPGGGHGFFSAMGDPAVVALWQEVIAFCKGEGS